MTSSGSYVLVNRGISMKRCFVIFAAALVASSAIAQSPHNKKPQKASASPLGDWVVSESTDKMTDKKICFIGHGKKPYVFSNESGNLLYVSFHGRGGIASYQIRLGKSQPTDMRLASDAERSADLLTIRLFDDEIGEADRVVVQGLTVLRDSFEEDISLKGYREARAELNRRCRIG